MPLPVSQTSFSARTLREIDDTIATQRRCIERFRCGGWFRKQVAHGEFWLRAGASAEPAEDYARRVIAEQVAHAEAVIAAAEAELAGRCVKVAA